MEFLCFAKKDSDDRQQHAAAKHLLRCAKERRRRVLRGPRIERAGRPKERSNEQDRHPDERMTVSTAGKSQRGTEQNSNTQESTGESNPNNRLWPRRHSKQPAKYRNVNRDR